MSSPVLGEFMGTAVLILLGDGVVAGCLLSRSKAQNGGWMVITAGWAFAVMAGAFTAAACGSSAAYLNPAVTVGMATASGNWSSSATLMAAQFAGAFVGAMLVWLQYQPHWSLTPDKSVKLACFCTSPAVFQPLANLLSEVIATFVLVLVAAAISSKAATAVGAPASGLGPFLVGSLVWGIGLSLGGTTGYAINPARDLGPRLAHAVLPIEGKGTSEWHYAAIPVIGPVIGGLLAGVLIRALGI